MEYHLFERRQRRRRTYRSSSSFDISSSRDDEDIEREIIDRAMEIERSRERNLRRQFEYIVCNVKELERRRQERYHRRLNSSDRFYQVNDSEIRHHRSSSRKCKETVYCQVTMTYHGNGMKKFGDEIMVLQENLIVFKGFLRAKENFTFKFQRRLHHILVKLDFFLNELFECSLAIDCEQNQIEQDNEFFQLIDLQSTQTNVETSKHRHSQSSSSSTINTERGSKPLLNQMSKERRTPIHQSAQRSPPSQSSGLRSTSTNEKKSNGTQAKTSSDDEDEQTLKENLPTKSNYGPPQVSTFARSSSESFSDDFQSTVKNENTKSSNELVKPSDESLVKKDESTEVEQEEDEESNDNTGFIGFLQLLNAMSGGAVRIPSANDDGDGIQGLLARLGIVTQTNSRKKSLNFSPHQKGNVENFLLVYLNDSLPDDSLVSQFRCLINSFQSFNDCDDCIAFINTISNEKILLIVNDRLGDPVVSRIQDLQQLTFIYILCQTNEQMQNWSTNQPKIRGIYMNINEIYHQIQEDIENEEEKYLTLTYAFPNLNTKDEPLFVLNQIVKEILLDQDEFNETKKELIDFVENEYENNLEQLKFIQLFDENYQKENIFQFYHKDQFIYKILNKSFRIPEVDILFKLRLFIQNLHDLILSSSTNLSLKTIYRKQYLTNEQIETLKKSIDGTLISFSNFFLASIRQPELSQIKDKQFGDEILFEIDISNSNEYMLFNDQILVTFGLVTRFIHLDKDQNGQIIVHLKTIQHDDQQFERLVEPIRKETRAPYPCLRLIKLFIELEQYSYAVYLGEFLLSQLSNAKKDPLLALARLYHSLGTTLYEKEDYDQALEVIKKSHEIYLRFLPDDAPQLSPTWNNMGSIYLRQGKTELALEYHEKALAIQLKSPSPDLPSIISYSNNIGGVYLKLDRYDEALVHFKRALQIEEQTLPTNHPELAGTYHRIGGVYFRQNNYEKALEYYNKTLDIELASLSENHPTVAVTYHNRATAFEGLGKLDEAVQSAEKAVERLLKTLPKEHPQVKMNQTYVDKLKQKLWVKQLFTS